MEKKPDGKEAKGFSGLDSMLSDVDETIASIPEAKASEITKRDSNIEVSERGDGSGKSANTTSGGFSTSGKWLFGIIAVAILFGILNNNEKRKGEPVTIYKPAPAPTPAPSAALAPVQIPSQRAQVNANPSPAVPFVPDIEKPPVGTNLVLSEAQMRYCITEKIKVSAIQLLVNRYTSKEVDDFNAMVSNYNSRCGSYRYREGTLDGVRSEVESRRVSIEREAKRHWRREHLGIEDHSSTSTTIEARATPKPPKSPLLENELLNYYGNDWDVIQDIATL
jgi:hypothetical protein